MKEKKPPQENLSRRNFVKTAAAGLGATALAGIAAASKEAAGGFRLHGIARCAVQGRIAVREAARLPANSSTKS